MKTLFLSALFLIISSTAAVATVPELDNCRDERECHLYCEIPANKPACWAYSQSKVLADATPSATPVFPIAALGNCQNRTACKAYCDVADHKTACAEYARIRALGKLPAAATLLPRAKTELGCDTLTGCKVTCEEVANKDKCRAFTTRFASQKIRERVLEAETLLQALERAFGCTSKQACMRHCQLSANRSACAAIFTSYSPAAKERERLKANCNTAEECKAWCTAHPGLCSSLQRPAKPEATSSGVLRDSLKTIPF